MKTIILILLISVSSYCHSQNILLLPKEEYGVKVSERLFLFGWIGGMSAGSYIGAVKCERPIYQVGAATLATAELTVAVWIIYPLLKPCIKKVFKKKNKRRYDLF